MELTKYKPAPGDTVRMLEGPYPGKEALITDDLGDGLFAMVSTKKNWRGKPVELHQDFLELVRPARSTAAIASTALSTSAATANRELTDLIDSGRLSVGMPQVTPAENMADLDDLFSEKISTAGFTPATQQTALLPENGSTAARLLSRKDSRGKFSLFPSCDVDPQGTTYDPEGLTEYDPQGTIYDPEGLTEYDPQGTTYDPEGLTEYDPEGTTYDPEGTIYDPEGLTEYDPEGTTYDPEGTRARELPIVAWIETLHEIARELDAFALQNAWIVQMKVKGKTYYRLRHGASTGKSQRYLKATELADTQRAIVAGRMLKAIRFLVDILPQLKQGDS